MNPHDLLGIALPTNEPDTAFQFFLPTLKYFTKVAKYSTILFNFQSPWTTYQIDESVSICRELGFEVRWSYNKYEIANKGLVPFNKIRSDACYNNPNSLFYVLMDDDFSFLESKNENLSGDTDYLRALHYLLGHERCGAVLLRSGFMRGKVPTHQVHPILDFIMPCTTERGIIVRKFEETTVVPKDAEDLLGSDEEKIAISWRINKGYYPAIIHGVKLRHYENDIRNSKNGASGVISGEVQYGWSASEILDNNANKYIREYYPEFNNPSNLVGVLGDVTSYKNAGGPTNYNELYTDYSKLSIDDIVSDIDAYVTTH